MFRGDEALLADVCLGRMSPELSGTYLGVHTALWPSLGAAQVLPWTQKMSPSLYLLPVEPWTRTTSMFHSFLTAEVLVQAPDLWGQRSCSSGSVLQSALGQVAYVGKGEKAHFGSLPLSNFHVQRWTLFTSRDCKKAVIFQARDQGRLCSVQ